MAAASAGDYLKPGRLEDVLALIQVLGIDEFTHRTENGLLDELQVPPQNAIPIHKGLCVSLVSIPAYTSLHNDGFAASCPRGS
jgi:hypothetical protein